MAFFDEEFKIDDLPDDNMGSFEPLPAGWYTASISEAEGKNTKAGTGKYLKIRFDIIGPTHQGRAVFTNINTRNPNPDAQRIGLSQLKSLMASIGIGSLKQEEQLIGATCEIKLAVKNDPTYGPGNEVKGYKAINGSRPPAPAPTQPASAPPAPSGTAAPPWASR